VHHRWHGTHRYDIQVLATHTRASTWVHWYSSLLQWSVPKGTDHCSIISMCAMSPVVDTSNISSCQKKLFQFSCGCEQFHYGRSFCCLVINVCNHGEHYKTPCIINFDIVTNVSSSSRLCIETSLCVRRCNGRWHLRLCLRKKKKSVSLAWVSLSTYLCNAN
jgi:hypothetical protein